jgi:hypothetical protein
MADQFIQQQITEFLRRNPVQANISAKSTPAKAAVPSKAAVPAKNSNVIMLQCTKFPKKSSDSATDDSDDSDNSDSSESCDCDEEGLCNHHAM